MHPPDRVLISLYVGVSLGLTFLESCVNAISQMIGKEFTLNPKMCILNIYPEDFVISKNLRFLLNVCFLEPERCIASSWKKDTLCGISQWIKGITSYFALKKISSFSKNKLDKFWVILDVFFSWLVQRHIQLDIWKEDLSWGRLAKQTVFYVAWTVFFVCRYIYVYVNEGACSFALIKNQ